MTPRHMTMRKPPPGATIATLIAIALLCGLGTWQVQRLQWKTTLLAQLDAAYAQTAPPAMTFDQVNKISPDPNRFTAASLRGHFLPGEIEIGIRTWQEEAGYHAVAAFALHGGGVILVNRGWVPAAQKDPKSRADSRPAGGEMTITGLLHAPGHNNPFIPANAPAHGEWFRWDIPAMAGALQASSPAPFILYEENEPGAAALPIRAALKLTLPNNHLAYAIFWFGIAGILAGMFYLRFMRRA